MLILVLLVEAGSVFIAMVILWAIIKVLLSCLLGAIAIVALFFAIRSMV